MFKLRIIILFYLLISRLSFFAQLTSYEFTISLPPDGVEVLDFDVKYQGVYFSTDDDSKVIIKDGVYTTKTIYLSISKETVREKSQYDVRNNYLFGVIDNDSVPCVLEGDTYYYAIKDEIKIAGPETSAIIVKSSENLYFVNFKESENYLPAKLEFTGNQLIWHQFDYETDTDVFNLFESQQKIGNKIVLAPTVTEWKLFDDNLIFPNKTTYRKTSL